MPPYLALGLWFIGIVWLFWSDPAKERGTSRALWVPLTWILIVATRLPSQWLGEFGTSAASAAAFEEGNAVDRGVYFTLIAAAAVTLLRRRINWSTLLKENLAISSFMAFGLLSVLWSDFPIITFKKWFRDIGIYLAVLVVLSDPRPVQATKLVLRRLCYAVIPLSIVLVKYFPELGCQYEWWTGTVSYVGTTTSKNMLGVASLISGLFLLWDTVSIWPWRKQFRTKRVIRLNLALLAMTLWLLNIANSATSQLCFAVGCLVVLLAQTTAVKRKPAVLKAGIPIVIVVYFFVEFVLGVDIRSVIAGTVGRDPSLTGRTHIWEVVLGLATNSFLGTGYETFWLGPRLIEVWRQAGPGLNQSHNGYLEVYLNLGLCGLVILGWVLLASYKAVGTRLSGPGSLGSLTLALWTILLIYNVTEAAFKGQLLFVIFLLGAITVSPRQMLIAKGSTDRQANDRSMFKGSGLGALA